MNRGLNLQLEQEHQDGTEWQFGALSEPGIVSIPLSEREEFLPIGETQRGVEDFQDCATRAPTNKLEALFTYHYHNKMQPENRKWLEDNGYVQDGRITFSDRFTAVLSGTTRNGNSMKAPLQSIHENGMLPKKLLPAANWMTWDDYHNPTAITQELKDLGKAFIARFKLNYEQVYRIHFSDVLKDDMLCVGLHAWPFPDVNDVYEREDGPFNHECLIYSLPEWQAYDNYPEDQKLGDYTKNLAPDYTFYDYGYRIYVSQEVVNPTQQSILITLYTRLIEVLRKLILAYGVKPIAGIWG